MTTAVTTRQDEEAQTPLALVQATLKTQGGALHAFLPDAEIRQRFVRVVIKAVQDNPDLQECTPESVVAAAVEAAQLGLEPSGHAGGAHLVPFNENVGTRERPRYERRAKLITDYKGDIDLARRSGKIEDAYAEVVRGSDTFVYDAAQATVREHVPDLKAARTNNPQDPKNPITHVYACVVHTSGYRRFVVMTTEEVEAIRSLAPGKNSPAWKNHWPEMAKKTVLKRALKTAPLPPAYRAVIGREDELIGLGQRAQVSVERPATARQPLAERLAQQAQPQLTGGNEPEAGVEASIQPCSLTSSSSAGRSDAVGDRRLEQAAAALDVTARRRTAAAALDRSPRPDPRRRVRPEAAASRRATSGRTPRPMPLPNATQLKEAAHAACVDHVEVEGLKRPVCVLRGQDKREIAREARQLAGLDR